MSAELIIQWEGRPASKMGLGAMCSIGRGQGNDLVLENPRASRNHALIRLLGQNRYFVADLGSANGTFLNGRPVVVPAELKNGDEIQIADCAMRFSSDETELVKPAQSMIDFTSRTSVEMINETVSILVVDIRNYTGLTEKLMSKDLSRLLGAWFKEAGHIIERQGGVIDKFIGDAVMAVWMRRAKANHGHARGPLNAARELVALANAYHQRVAGLDSTLSFSIGCGVHLGQAMLGNLGEAARRDFTALGDCVNVAFRLESLCKELGRPILVSQQVRETAGDEFPFEDLGSRSVKGRSEPIRVFALGS